MGNTSPKDMDSLLPLMNMVIYSIDKVKKLRLNREVSGRKAGPLLVNSAHQRDLSRGGGVFCTLLATVEL